MELRMERLRKKYGTQTVLSVDSLSVPSARITAVVGPNGAGKSTLLYILAGLLEPEEGQVYYDGRRECPMDQVTMVFQEPCLISSTVEKNMAWPLKIRGASSVERTAEIRGLAEELGLLPLLKRRVRGLSLGEMQKVALARALSFHPRLLLLDEPCASIDPHTTMEIERMLARWRAAGQTTMVIVTHDLAQARRLADQVVLLHRGQVIESGKGEAFFNRPVREETRRFTEGGLLI